MVVERDRGVTVHGEADDVRGDERVAVTIAADPGPHRHRSARVDGFDLATTVRHHALELGGDRRQGLEQAGVVVAQRFVDLVTDPQLRHPQERRLPERDDADRERPVDVGELGVVGDVARAIVEKIGDLVHHVEDRLSPHLGRMGRDHRADTQIADHRGDQLEGHVGRGEAIEAGREAPRARRAPGHPVMATASFEVHVLGGVGEQRQPVERTDHVQLLIDRPAVEQESQGVDVAGAGTTGVDGDAADRLDQVERVVTGLASDDVAQQATEQPDVGTQCRVARRRFARGRIAGRLGHPHQSSPSRANRARVAAPGRIVGKNASHPRRLRHR